MSKYVPNLKDPDPYKKIREELISKIAELEIEIKTKETELENFPTSSPTPFSWLFRRDDTNEKREQLNTKLEELKRKKITLQKRLDNLNIT